MNNRRFSYLVYGSTPCRGMRRRSKLLLLLREGDSELAGQVGWEMTYRQTTSRILIIILFLIWLLSFKVLFFFTIILVLIKTLIIALLIFARLVHL